MHKTIHQLPGDFGLPFLGNTPDLFLKRELSFLESYQKFGDTFKTNLLGKKAIVFSDPDVCQTVLSNQDNHFSMKKGWFFLQPLLSGLFFQDGQKHLLTRKLLFPAFHGESVENCFETINDCVVSHLNSWDEKGSIHLCDEFHSLALRISCTLFIGQELGRAQELFADFLDGLSAIFRLNIPGTKFGKAIKAREQLKILLQSVMQTRREESERARPDILDVLMHLTDENGQGLTDDEIIEQTIQFIFAGHETTARMLTWSVYELIQNPQEVCRFREAYHAIERSGFNLTSILKNSYLDEFLLEVERLYSVSPFLPRGLNEDIELGGYKIPKEWLVIIAPSIVHQRPELFKNPKAFDPSRYQAPRLEHKAHPFSLMGFGGGQHRCLGEFLAKVEMKLILLKLVSQYEFSLDADVAQFRYIKPLHKIEPKIKLIVHKNI